MFVFYFKYGNRTAELILEKIEAKDVVIHVNIGLEAILCVFFCFLFWKFVMHLLTEMPSQFNTFVHRCRQFIELLTQFFRQKYNFLQSTRQIVDVKMSLARTMSFDIYRIGQHLAIVNTAI